MKLQVKETAIRLLDLRTRMPFKYGIAVMTALPHCFVELRVELDGRIHRGLASDGLPPKWFTKHPGEAFADELRAMLEVIEQACARARELPPAESVFAWWQALHAAQAAWAAGTPHPPLLWGLGVSLVERALIDAFCRGAGLTFAQALHGERLGLRLGDVHRELEGRRANELLPGTPLRRVQVRHTVGLADPLTEADLPEAERLHDGLPQSLEASIRAYGLHWFKIKICGDPATDVPRLRALHTLLRAACPGGFRFTLDGNEQYRDVAAFRGAWEAMRDEDGLRAFFDRLLFVEQPFHREVALGADIAEGLRGWPGHPPLLIDESDGELASLPRALDGGYAGTSHKNCKGIFKGLANRCLIEKRNREGAGLLMSGEDLANVGPVALLQDLAVMAVLGIEHVERNGHHYFRGLDFLNADTRARVLAAHPDLYRPLDGGIPALRIEDGAIALDSLLAAPFGYGIELDTARYTAREEWRPGEGM